MADNEPKYEDTAPVEQSSGTPQYQDTAPHPEDAPHANIDPAVQKLMNGAYNFDDYWKLTPAQKAQFDDLSRKDQRENAAGLGQGLAHGAFSPIKLASKLIPGEHTVELEDVQAPVERTIANLIGDDATKKLYEGKTDEALAAANKEQNDADMTKAPVISAVGEAVGALPANIAAGSALGGLATRVGLGATAAGATPLVARVAQGATNAAGFGALGEAQGIEQSNAPTLQERATEALPTAAKGALLGTALEAGGVAASKPGQQALVRTLGPTAATAAKYGTGAAAGAVALPLATGVNPLTNPGRAAEGGIMGLLATKFGPKFFDDTELGRTLKKQYEYGKQGESLRSAADLERVSGQAEKLAGETSQGIMKLDEQVSQPAMAKIQSAYQDALQETGTKLGLKTQELSDFIQDQGQKAGTALDELYKQKAAEGATVDVKDVVNGMKEQLEKAVASGAVVGSANKEIVQDIVNSLNDRLVQKGIPIKLDKTSILDSTGNPIIQSAKISGKSVPLSQLPQVPQGVSAPVSASSETSVLGPGSENPMTQQTLKESQTITPEQPKGPLSIPEARELKGTLSQLAYNDPSIPPAVRPIVAQGYRDLNDTFAPLFQEGDQNALLANNKKYTAFKQIGDIVGEPIPDRITKESMPPEKMTRIIQKIGNAVKEGDKAKFQQIFDNLKVIDPAKAEQFQNTLTQISEQQAALAKGVNQAPAQQLQTLGQQGLATPELEQAGKQIQDVESLKSSVGGPNNDLPGQPSAETRQFVNNLHETSGSGKGADNKAILDILRRYNPELASKLETEGTDIAQRLGLVSSNTAESLTGMKRPIQYALKKAGQGANLAGEVVQTKGVPFANNFSQILSGNIQQLGEFAAPLQDASKRGAAALSAMHFSLYQNNPDYRKKIDALQEGSEANK